MNKYILLVMKWLNDKDSVSQEQLNENGAAAYDDDAYLTAYAASYAAYAAYTCDAAAADAAYAAAKKWVDKYFERTGENKQDYIDVIKAGKAKPVFTQEMSDNGELPKVGMECLIKKSHQDDSYFNKGYIIGLSQDKKWLVFSDYLNNLEQHHIDNGVYEFKPLPKPIELIDGKAYQFDVRDKGGLLSGIYNNYDKKLHVGPDHYFDLLSATNIQQLFTKSELNKEEV